MTVRLPVAARVRVVDGEATIVSAEYADIDGEALAAAVVGMWRRYVAEEKRTGEVKSDCTLTTF